MDKPQQYKQCMEHMKEMCPGWYNKFRKHMNGAMSVCTYYKDLDTGDRVLHVANPDRDIGLLLLDLETKLEIMGNVEGCCFNNVAHELYRSVRQVYEDNKRKGISDLFSYVDNYRD